MIVMRVILCLALFSVLLVSHAALASPRLNKWTAMQIGLDALKAKYPKEYSDLVLTYRPFVAKFEDGVWHVHGTKFVPGGRAPAIEVRDRDQKILKIDLHR